MAKPKAAVPALAKLLGEKNAPVSYVASILGAIGPDAKEAVPALLALVPKDRSAGYGIEGVALALAKIDGYEQGADMLDPIDVCDRRHGWTGIGR